MKIAITCLVLLALVLGSVMPVQAAEERGGVIGFIVGCCFGIRSAGAYNDGKDIHWREWGLLIPIFSIVVGIMNGIDGMEGKTTADLARQYGSSYY